MLLGRPANRRRDGIVLVVVLFFVLLLTASVATFAKIALIDHMIVGNRDARARADALARGGIRLAIALLLEDKLRESQSEFQMEHGQELWAQLRSTPIVFDDGSSLRLEIEDAGARLNLNAAVVVDEEGAVDPKSLELVTRLLAKAIDEMALPRSEQRYDAGELAANLIDYIDADSVRQDGAPEDDLYQKRDPPARPANRALLSVDELRHVEGFDGEMVEALRPYVTVYPYAGGGGINPNTAPPHVLSLLFFDDEVELRLADEDTIRRVLRVRAEGGLVCGEDQSAEGCTPIRDIVTNAIFPEPQYASNVFVITAHGIVRDVHRRIEAVLDRSRGASPLLLSWRVL